MVPPGCLLSGLDLSASQSVRQLQLTNDIIIQGHRIQLGKLKLNVFTVMGALDDLEVKGGGAVMTSYQSFFVSITMSSSLHISVRAPWWQ